MNKNRPIFSHKSVIGNNQTNDSQYTLGFVTIKNQTNSTNDDLNSKSQNLKSKFTFKKYLLIEHKINKLLSEKSDIKKIKESYLLQQNLAKTCPGILPVYTMFNEGENTFEVATKFPKNGILSTYLPGFKAYPNQINSFEKLSPTKKTIIMYGIALTLKFIHSKKIFFHNLSPDNVFLDKKFYPFLTNFNKCVENANDEDLQFDVFSYSLIYVGMFGLIDIIHPDSNSDYIINILSSMKNGARPRLDDKTDLTEKQKNALLNMWDIDDRPSFDDIICLFDNGDLLFTGTDMDKFEDYKNFVLDPSYQDQLNENVKNFCVETHYSFD